MDIPGFRLSNYGRIHPKLRPEFDHDLAGDLMSLVEDGGRAVSAKAWRRLFDLIEEARAYRDAGLSGGLRRATRQWEATYVDAIDAPAAPASHAWTSLAAVRTDAPYYEADVTAIGVPS